MAEDFHDVSIAVLQNRDRFVYPRATVEGYVIYHASEPDGDSHFNLAAVDYGTLAKDAAIEDYVVCEIIPEIPLPVPDLHAYIRVNGIWRWDIGHGWPELHPVLSWQPAVPPAG